MERFGVPMTAGTFAIIGLLILVALRRAFGSIAVGIR